MANVIEVAGCYVDTNTVAFIRPVHQSPDSQVAFIGGGSLTIPKMTVAEVGKVLGFAPPPAPAK